MPRRRQAWLCVTVPPLPGVPSLPLSTTRSPRVDFLRGLSILAVLLLHFSLSYDLSDSPLSRVVPKSWIEAIAFNGNYGVTVFS